MKNLSGSFMGFGRKCIGNIHKEDYYQNKSSGNLSNSVSGPKVIHFLSNSFSIQTVSNKNIIPKMMSQNKMANCRRFDGKERFDPINGTTNQAAEILIDNPENARSQGLDNNRFTITTLAYLHSGYNLRRY